MLVKTDVARRIIVCLHPERFLHVQLPEGSQEELQKTLGHQGSFILVFLLLLFFVPCCMRYIEHSTERAALQLEGALINI